MGQLCPTRYYSCGLVATAAELYSCILKFNFVKATYRPTVQLSTNLYIGSHRWIQLAHACMQPTIILGKLLALSYVYAETINPVSTIHGSADPNDTVAILHCHWRLTRWSMWHDIQRQKVQNWTQVKKAPPDKQQLLFCHNSGGYSCLSAVYTQYIGHKCYIKYCMIIW